eukprot:Gregarina_sp_Poly_1__9947@NODE_656_length_6918_cov_257_889943_g498_i0_p5_GENE_NODE_656_length_6918_cov_257_889943_g498_i0NODE_656_length_6918_cov_257_889943_g498_i0_p5_ORF_typecomplete_len184_score18_20Rad10/PF03834_14/8_3e31SRP68/PF16969_5/0_22_NODE_656_length_6918_cov_257_889943_g498_i026713222
MSKKLACGDDAVVASPRQKQSPLLQSIRNVAIIFREVPADFLIGSDHIGVIFIALSYHRLHQQHYLPHRLNAVKNLYRLRVLLCLIDVEDANKLLLDVTCLAFKFGMSLFLAWSYAEAAKVLEAFKIYERKPSDFLLPRMSHLSPLQRAVEILCTIPRITKLDAVALLQQFGSLEAVLMVRQY